MKINSNLKRLIESNTLCLATSKNNIPHVIYVAEVKVKNNKLIVTDNFMKKTVSNILINPKVSLAFLNNESGIELIGTVKYFNDGVFLDFIKKIEGNKNLPAKGALVISISKIKGMH